MIERIATPKVGDGLRASWGASVASAINRLGETSNREKMLDNQRNRRGGAAESRLEAWALQIRQDPRNEEEKTYVVYLPPGSLIWDGKEITPDEIDGVQPYGEDGDWYELVKEFKSAVKLIIKEDSFAVLGEDDEEAIATITIGTVDDFKIVDQIIYGPLIINKPIEPDDFSIDLNGGEEGEHKLQIAHFNDDENDSGKGLANRLKVDLVTGEVTGEEKSGLMLLARKDGKIIYVPLTGDGEDPDAPNEEQKPKDPCEHDPSAMGGVTPSQGGIFEEQAVTGSSSTAKGGVLASGEKHQGDNDCNCD